MRFSCEAGSFLYRRISGVARAAVLSNRKGNLLNPIPRKPQSCLSKSVYLGRFIGIMLFSQLFVEQHTRSPALGLRVTPSDV